VVFWFAAQCESTGNNLEIGAAFICSGQVGSLSLRHIACRHIQEDRIISFSAVISVQSLLKNENYVDTDIFLYIRLPPFLSHILEAPLDLFAGLFCILKPALIFEC
jgi:hypothetical protein